MAKKKKLFCQPLRGPRRSTAPYQGRPQGRQGRHGGLGTGARPQALLVELGIGELVVTPALVEKGPQGIKGIGWLGADGR